MLQEYLVKKALEASFNAAKRILKELEGRIDSTASDIEESLNYHLRAVKNWSREINFSDLRSARRTRDVFVPLDLLVQPRRLRLSHDEVTHLIPLRSLFTQYSDHMVLLGQPGAGKTTSMKFVCQSLFYDEDFCKDRFSFPLLIRCRDLTDTSRHWEEAPSLFDTIMDILGLKISFPDTTLGAEYDRVFNRRKYLREKLVSGVLEELRVLLIIDGFDELTGEKSRNSALKDITNLALHLDSARMCVTSRTGDFVYNIENTVQYEVSPLDRHQISSFAHKWLSDEHAANTFLDAVQKSPFGDTAIRPLTLAHLCAIYERIGTIPEKPKTVYKKVINLLLEEWDQQRSVRRTSRYAKFEADRKFDFLCHLAQNLTTSVRRTVFSERDLIDAYGKICGDFDLLEDEAKRVARELETHTGLFLQSGYQEFEFAHKSLQEYLTAEYMVKLPSIPSAEELVVMPNELAIAISLSSKPSEYFCEVVFHRLKGRPVSKSFVESFLARVLVEKPNLNPTSELGLALVILISLYVENGVLVTSSSTYKNPGVVLQTFEGVVASAASKSSLNLVQPFYEMIDTITVRDESGSILLHRLHRNAAMLPPHLPIPPQFLYLTDGLIKAFSLCDIDKERH